MKVRNAMLKVHLKRLLLMVLLEFGLLEMLMRSCSTRQGVEEK